MVEFLTIMKTRAIGAHLKIVKAAALLDKGVRWVKDEGKAGRLDVYEIGGEHVVSVESINRMLENCRVGPKRKAEVAD